MPPGIRKLFDAIKSHRLQYDVPDRTLPFMRTLRRTTWPTSPYNKVMINIVFPASRRRLWGYWWAPVAILAVVLAVAAYLRPYQDLQLSDLQPSLQDSINALDKTFGAPVKRSFKYSTRRIYSSSIGPMEVEIRVKLEPLGGGLVLRQDDWYYTKSNTIVNQERFILFRNLFSLNTRSREVAPVVHDLLGRIGWFNDSTQSIRSKVEGGAPDSALWKMDIFMDSLSETDGNGLTLQSTPYQRRLQCERSTQVDGSEIGSDFKGNYPKVTCKSTSNNPPTERQSEFAYLPEYGIFLLLGYQQQTGGTDKLDVKGSYATFEILQ